MTFYIKRANTFRMTPESGVDIRRELPPGTFAVKVDQHGFFIEEIDGFTLPPKLYGDCDSVADRIINSFWDRPNSTGVFLEGEKGSGKTLLSKNVSIKMLAQGVPTLVINSPLAGEEFNTFMQSINQPKVVIFDEFEKVYDEDTQERVLTLFDGVYPSKTLFLVTCNDSWRVDANMKNRPGRMFYMLTFKGLDQNFIREYAEENLKDKSQVDSILVVSTLFRQFNFDMLKALVEEMNRYGETAQEAIKLLNTKPTADSDTFEVELKGNGDFELIPGHERWSGNPLGTDVLIPSYHKESGERKNFRFNMTDLKEVNGAAGTFSYVNKDGVTCILRRAVPQEVNWNKLL